MDSIERIKKHPYLIAFVVVIGIMILVLRGPHISNALKKMILPQLEAIIGGNVVAQRIHLNMFPLFIEAKGLKVFDEAGERLLYSESTKAYIGLSGLISKKLVINRLVLKEPEVNTKKRKLDQILENVKTGSGEKSDDTFKATVKAIEIKEGDIHFIDQKTDSISVISGLNGEIILGETRRIKASAERVNIKKEGWPEIEGDLDINLKLRTEAGSFEISNVTIGFLDSKIKGSGEYSEGRAELKAEIELLAKTVKDLFKLEQSGEGKIKASGDITYTDNDIEIDLQLAGQFYLETLMELLKVKERIEGLVDVKGEIKGPLNNIRANGTATLNKGDLYNVDIDSVTCNVSYADGTMSFTEGVGRLYNGSAKASAAIQLPVVNSFTLNIDFSDIDSNPLFKLIGWDPGFKPGKVKGNLIHAGAHFSPSGLFEYKSTVQGEDVLGRVRDIKGRYDMKDSLLSLTDVNLRTGQSDLNIDGLVDIEQKSLDLHGIVKTGDLTDISSPYYRRLQGTGEFLAKIQGTFDEPLISGNVKLKNSSIEGYPYEMLDADITYRKELLNIHKLTIRKEDELHEMKGNIYFKQAKELFDLSTPEFDLNASLENADLEKFVKIFYADFKGIGKLRSEMKIGGTADDPEVSGNAVIETAKIYKVPFDSASSEITYKDNRFIFSDIKVKRGKSLLHADAFLDTGGTFSFNAISDRLNLSNMITREIQGDIIFSAKAEGHGTFDNPSIYVDAKMIRGTLKGKPVGSGVITGFLEDRIFSLKANMIDAKIQIKANGRFEDEIPWNADIDIHTGRYDFLITSFLKDIPEDLILSLNSTISLHGDKNNIFGSAVIKHAMLSMYGYSFSNEEEIILALNNRQLVLNKISMRSGNTYLSIKGSYKIGEEYDLVLEGKSALSPFKSLYEKIGLLKGDAEFVLSITGDWESPVISGGLSLSNGSFGLKDYYYRISSLNGYLYIDEDRIVLQKLSGQVGGGDVELSGILYLKKFSVKRFYIEAKLDNITSSVSTDFNVNFGGNILYKGTDEEQIISGEIMINRARYKERVEWKSWLLKAKKGQKYKAEISDIENADLNIRVTGRDNIVIDNNVARSKVSADLLLKGKIYRPILFGRIESSEGKVYFRNNEFRILNASADFSDPNQINPIMTVAAETIVKGYKINMNLEGQLDHFNMSLSSDPPLKEMDIFALLTLGKTGGELKGLEGGIGASEATSFVTGKLQDVVEERLTTLTGLDRLEIDPYVSKTTGTVEPRVTVSKRLLGDRMFADYTTTIGSTEEQIVKIEYFLDKNISLIGVRDERGILGGDIRFRFEFK